MGEPPPELSYVVTPETPCSCDILVMVLIQNERRQMGA